MKPKNNNEFDMGNPKKEGISEWIHSSLKGKLSDGKQTNTKKRNIE